MIFKHKNKQPQVTINNRHLHYSGICKYRQSEPYHDAFKLALLRRIDTNSMSDEEKERINKETNETHKSIAEYFDTVDQADTFEISKYYHDKYLPKFTDTLEDSAFKSYLVRYIEKSNLENMPSDYNVVNSLITSYSDNNLINFHYHRLNQELFWQIAQHLYFRQLKTYADTGKYRVQFGKLNFADEFKLTGANDCTAQLTLPYSYKWQVLGSGLEVINGKYLTISLRQYDSIIKDCTMYQAQLLKVKKPFKDSQIEQAYIAKIDDRVLIAKSHELLMRKVIKEVDKVRKNQAEEVDLDNIAA